MVKETMYQKCLGHYVRIYRKSGPSVGKLRSIGFAYAILNPHVSVYSTDLRMDVRVVNSPWIIPYDTIESVQEIQGGKKYMARIVADSRIMNDINIQLKIKELKAKGVQDKILERLLLEALY